MGNIDLSKLVFPPRMSGEKLGGRGGGIKKARKANILTDDFLGFLLRL